MMIIMTMSTDDDASADAELHEWADYVTNAIIQIEVSFIGISVAIFEKN